MTGELSSAIRVLFSFGKFPGAPTSISRLTLLSLTAEKRDVTDEFDQIDIRESAVRHVCRMSDAARCHVSEA